MNLQATVDISLKDFFQWWGRELAFFIPVKVRQFFNDEPAKLIFSVKDSGFDYEFITVPESKESNFQSHINSADLNAFQTLLAQHPDLEKSVCILRLNDEHALARFLYLPEAASENLEQVVRFELDRYTPFNSDQVYFSVIPLGKTGQGQIQIMLILTPQAVLDELISQLNTLGIQPHRIVYGYINDHFPELSVQYNLLPERYQPTSSRLAKFGHWILSGLIFLLFLAVVIYPVWQQTQAVVQLKSEIKALEKDTRFVDSQQQEIDSLRDETQKLLDIKNQTPELGAVLNELSHLLKDDTWLTNLQYSEKHMQIQGQSPTASELIGLLEASAIFSKVSFVSPLTQDKATGLERFQISMDVNPQVIQVHQDNSDAATNIGNTNEPTAPKGVTP